MANKQDPYFIRQSTLSQLRGWWKAKLSPVKAAAPYKAASTSLGIESGSSYSPKAPTGYQLAASGSQSTQHMPGEGFLPLLRKISKGTFRFVVPAHEALQVQPDNIISENTTLPENSQYMWQETEKLLNTGSFKFDAQSETFYCSPNTYNLLNIDAPEAVQGFQSLLPFFSVQDQDALRDCWYRATLFCQDAEASAALRQASSESQVWIRLKLRAFKQEDELTHIVGSFEDVTEAVAEQNRLLQEKEAAIEAAQAKSSLMSQFSHEIRTPLNSIVGLSYLLLQDGNRTMDVRNYLNSMHFSAQHLLHLSNNALDYSKLEAGRLELEVVNFKLRNLLAQLHQSFYATACEKQLSFELLLDESVPYEVAGDPIRLTQVLQNLVSNAIKFTKAGSVKLEVDVVYQSDSACILEFAVSDTGIGIPEESQQLVFESYVQAKPSMHRKFGGTGLGLSITRKIVELHEGEIELTSKEGVGTEFRVRLKYGTSIAPPAQAAAAPETSGNNLGGMKVLVIDDDDINNLVTCELLTHWHAAIDTAENGQLALEKLRNGRYDLVLLDLYMPTMDGFETIRRIREAGLNIPVIALTGTAHQEEVCQLLALGVNDYLIKPFHPQHLYDKLHQLSAIANCRLSAV